MPEKFQKKATVKRKTILKFSKEQKSSSWIIEIV